MIKKLYPFLSLSLLLACTNIENAKPTNRTSFVRYYGTGINHAGVMALPDTDGGYILVGNVVEGDYTDITVIKTDERGNTLWKTVVPDGSANSVVISDDGYYITGDSIGINNESGVQLSEIITTKAHLFKVGRNGEYDSNVDEVIIKDSPNDVDDTRLIDYKGHASVIVGDTIYLLGSRRLPQIALNQTTFEEGFIAAYSLDGLTPSTSSSWPQSYIANNYDFKNCNMLHQMNDNLIWAATYFRDADLITFQQALVVSVPKDPNLVPTPKNNQTLQESNRTYEAADLQKSISSFGLVGTYALSDGTASNIFFARVNFSGSIIENSVRFFDGIDLLLPEASKDNSKSDDQGRAITGTNDGGFVLACTFNSTLEKGNGGKDILLIKVDGFGNFLWSELLGGSGDETPSSIRETTDGSLLVCGTNMVSGLSSLVLIKTDRNGKLSN